MLSLHCGKLQRSTEGKQNVNCVFIDMEKAYDRISRAEVWNCLRLKGVPEGCETNPRYITRVHNTIRCAAEVTWLV